MSEFSFAVESGATKKLLTAGKYCDRDIVVNDDPSAEDDIIKRQIVSYSNDRVLSLGPYAFMNCSLLTELNLPNLQAVGMSAINTCTSLTELDFPVLNDIYSYAFNACSSLKKLVLRNTTVARNRGVAFNNTPIANGTGFIYVPDNLVEDYRQATNWTVFADQIKPISELEG